MFHTQEKWPRRLTQPIKCSNPSAWLGSGYYFWDDEVDAIAWGRNSKRNTGYFEIYIAQIISEKILDTVFNREQYEFWKSQIEKIGKNILKKTGKKATIKELNEYFVEKGTMSELDGILSQDIPTKSEKSVIEGLFYNKRIQLVVFNLKIVNNFRYKTEGRC